MIEGKEVSINGDGETSRDFCYIANAVQANVRAALADVAGPHHVYNVAVGERTSLNQLFSLIRSGLADLKIQYNRDAVHLGFRAGDVRHSQADIGKARECLGYVPSHQISAGIKEALPWYIRFHRSRAG